MTDFSPDIFSPAASSEKAFLKQYVPTDDDEGVLATFVKKLEIMPYLSQQAGKEIKEYKEYVRIVVKGDDKKVVFRPITEQDKRRFPFAWQQYQRGEEGALRGTPLSELFDTESEIVPHYNAMNIFTLEDLAQISDGNMQNLGAGARENRLRAKEYLEKATGASKRIADLEAKIAKLEGKKA